MAHSHLLLEQTGYTCIHVYTVLMMLLYVGTRHGNGMGWSWWGWIVVEWSGVVRNRVELGGVDGGVGGMEWG